MQILADTTVWSEALGRKKDTVESEEILLYQLIKNDENIILTGIILQEILTGIKSGKLFSDIKNILKDFNYIEPGIEDYIYAAELKNTLMKKGITAGAIDFLIAGMAMNHDIYLATYDKDFKNIAQHSNLKIIDPEIYNKKMKKQ